MYTLFHHPFCPHSRFIRLIIGEHGLDLARLLALVNVVMESVTAVCI